jgi:hypothetical protein
MTPDEVGRLGIDETLIFSRGRRPIRAALLRYHEQPYFKRLATIKPPAASDRTIAASPVNGTQANATPVQPTAAAPASGALNGMNNGAANGGAPKAPATVVKEPGGAVIQPPVEFLGFAAGKKPRAAQEPQ